MLSTLLESRSRKAGSRGGAIASLAFHGLIVAAAAYANASGAAMASTPERIEKIHWVPAKAAQPAMSRSQSSPSRRSGAPSIVPPRVLLDLSVPSVSVDVPIGPAEPMIFGGGGGNTAGSTEPGTGGSSVTTRTAYVAEEVDRQVSVIAGSARPEYPGSLRANGVEGEVIAQFVVDERGRVQASTIRIVSATNELFAASVRIAVTRMKFHPAEVSGRAVPQMVQQLFSFRLDK